MTINPRFFIAGICLFAAIHIQSFAVDATYNNLEVDGNFDANGQVYLSGSNTMFGTSGTINPGLTLNYTDGATGTINFVATPSSAVWQWAVTSGTSAYVSMMLDAGNQLTLYTIGTSGTAGITLNPAGTSTFAGSITAGGTNNVLPNQVLVSGSSILTESLGDGRYLTQTTGDARYVLSSTASGYLSVAIGTYSVASGSYSTALGYYSTAHGFDSYAAGDGASASGSYSTAIGGGFVLYNASYSTAIGKAASADSVYTTAIGFYSEAFDTNSSAIGYETFARGYESSAFGAESWAIGDYSVALGYNSESYGDYSTAIGPNTEADGDFSTAAGQNTDSTGYCQFVVGQWNIYQGSPSDWVATDNLFIVGNGVDGDHPSNAFVVNKNGDTAVNGALTVSGTSGSLNTIVNGGLAVTGTTVQVVVGSGTVATVEATGTNNLMLVPQQGDLSMGAFVAGQQPPSH